MTRAVLCTTALLAFAAGTTAAGDPGFGNGGVLANTHPLLIEQNGTIVAFGPGGNVFRLTPAGARLSFAFQPKSCDLLLGSRPDGTLIGACGKSLLHLSPDGQLIGTAVEVPDVRFTALAVGADGTIAAGAQASDQSTVLLRFLRDRTPDTQFGRATLAGSQILSQGIAVDSVGRILVANGTLHRYPANGQLDASFTPPTSGATMVALTADGRILVCCEHNSLLRLLADGGPDQSFGTAGIAPYEPDGYDASVDALVPTADDGAILVGSEVIACATCVGPPGAQFFYAQRIRRDGSRGAVGESPGFFDPDKDCWDETGDWAGIAHSGAVYVAGDACTGNDTLFTMRYTSRLRRDYGPFLTLDLSGWKPRADVTAEGVVVVGTVVANHAASISLSVRPTTGATDSLTGHRLLLLAGSRIGALRLSAARRTIETTTASGHTTTFRLVLPSSAVTPTRDFAIVVEGRRPRMRYRASAVGIFVR
jgi:hypothetical protein